MRNVVIGYAAAALGVAVVFIAAVWTVRDGKKGTETSTSEKGVGGVGGSNPKETKDRLR